MKVKYISYGKHITGGYLHELFFVNALCDGLKSKGSKIEFLEIRFPQLFIGFFAYLKLQIYTFKALKNVNIAVVVSRMAWPVLVKVIFNRQFKSFIVLHHLDWSVPFSFFHHFYIKVFLFLLNTFKTQRIGLIVVSPFWLNEVQKNYNKVSVFLFPNLLNPNDYKIDTTITKSNCIHLGQWSWKNDSSILDLALQLHQKGFTCYFSTNIPDEQCIHAHYSVIYEDRLAYLKRMAAASWTLALTQYKEGWNRVAHESILLGTPVIGYANGGLSDLLKISQSIIVDSTDDALNHICHTSPILAEQTEFKSQYHSNQSEVFLAPIYYFLS